MSNVLPEAFKVKLEFCDELHIELQSGQAVIKRTIVCTRLRQFLIELTDKYGNNLLDWPLPKGKEHFDLLIRKTILLAKGEWQLPYQQTEICHCRAVPTENVESAVMMGAHDIKTISRWTSASTSCGTCQPDVESVLKYILDEV